MKVLKCFYFGILLFGICVALGQCAREPLMAMDQFDEATDNKPEDGLSLHKRPSFFIGSRYGRSGGGISQRSATSKTRRLIVVPRNERFFLGSRYGKRNGEYMMSDYEQNGVAATAATAAGSAAVDALTDTQLMETFNKLNGNNDSMDNLPQIMSCFYSGIRDYYRCNTIPGLNNIINQLSPQQFVPGDNAEN